MKKIKINQKLQLSKEIISNFQLNAIKGGKRTKDTGYDCEWSCCVCHSDQLQACRTGRVICTGRPIGGATGTELGERTGN